MTRSPQELSAWAGRELFDPYDVRIGTIAAVRGGALAVELADGDTREVPLARAARSGRAIRTPYTAEQVLARRVAPPPPPVRPHAVQSAVPPAAGTRKALIGALREAHAQLRATRERPAALRWRVEDSELAHDLTFHRVAVEGHAAEVRRRLAELGDTRAPLRDGVAQLGARLHVKRLRVATEDAQEAVDLARDERRTWQALGAVARRHHDTPTAALADRGRADAEALLSTLAFAPNRSSLPPSGSE